MGTLLVSRGCHPGLVELALQAEVAAGGAGMQSVREVLWLVLRGCHLGLVELA
jgi:hypothetical protein